MSIYFALGLTFFVFVTTNAARLLLALYALQLGASPLAVGILAATFSGCAMLLALQAGKLIDRFGSRWPLVYATAGAGAGMLVEYFFPGLPALYVAAALNGCAFSFFSVAMQNLIGQLSTPENRAQYYSNYSLVGSIINFFSPLFIGLSIDHWGHATACLNLALWSLAPLIMLLIWGRSMPGRSRKSAAPPSGILMQLADPKVRRVLATSSLFTSGLDLFQFYMPIYGHSIGLSASAIGSVLGMYAVSGFLMRFMLARLLARFSVEAVLTYAFFLSALSFLLVPFFANVVALALIAFLFGLGMSCGQPIVTMLTFDNSAPGRTGEALGLRMTVNHITRVVGPTTFGAIGSAFGLFPVFWGSALMLGIGGMLSRRKRDS